MAPEPAVGSEARGAALRAAHQHCHRSIESSILRAGVGHIRRKLEGDLYMRKFLGPAIVAGAALLGTALPTLADPNLPIVGAHRHFIQTPTGELVQVGPRLCDDPTNP